MLVDNASQIDNVTKVDCVLEHLHQQRFTYLIIKLGISINKPEKLFLKSKFPIIKNIFQQRTNIKIKH